MASGVAEAGRGQSTTMAKLSKWFGRRQSPRGGGLKGCWGLGTILERARVKSVTTPQPVQAISVLQTGRWGQQRVISVTVIHLLSGAGRRSQCSSVLSHGCITLSGEGGSGGGMGYDAVKSKAGAALRMEPDTGRSELGSLAAGSSAAGSGADDVAQGGLGRPGVNVS